MNGDVAASQTPKSRKNPLKPLQRVLAFLDADFNQRQWVAE
jgi:hypothetical protein